MAAASDPALTVRYRAAASATADVAKPWLEVINTSDRPVNLTDVTLRYDYTADDDAPYGSNCVQTALDCTSVTQRTVAATAPAPGADHYLQIGCTAAADTLKPGGSSKAIGLQLYRIDDEKLDQSNDRSFNAEYTTYQPSELVTAYHDGALVWGEEPDGTTPGPAPAPSDTPASTPPAPAAPPAGVFFDDFHYAGPDDPALTANQWEVRTGEGGPGITDSWSAEGVAFPAGEAGKGQALRLRASTDGTEGGTRQAEFQSSRPVFHTGTLVARVHVTDEPVSGKDGDHVAQNFFTISPDHTSSKYSELD